MKHTQGDFKDGSTGWKIGSRKTNGIDGFEVHWSDDGECITDHVYAESDAKLIAAAPDLLEALQELKRAGMGYYGKKEIELVDLAIKKATE